MGQYYRAVNVTKHEYVDAWDLGGFSKLWEWCANRWAGIFPYLIVAAMVLQDGVNPDNAIANTGSGIYLPLDLSRSFFPFGVSTTSKMASAPHVGGSIARQRGRPPPPHSSVKRTFDPSLLNVAECQNAKFESLTAATRFGFAGLRMSRRIPFPAQVSLRSPAPLSP